MGEGEEEGLSEDLVDEVDIVSGAVEDLPDQPTLQIQVSHVVRLVERQTARLPGKFHVYEVMVICTALMIFDNREKYWMIKSSIMYSCLPVCSVNSTRTRIADVEHC